LTLVLTAYFIAKRTRLVSRLAPHTRVHVVVGAIAMGATGAHISSLGHGLTGALAIDMLGALITGVFGAIAYATLPGVLSRLEASATLPEDLSELVQTAERDLVRELSGKSEGQKALFKRLLDPYRRSRTGWVSLVLSRRSRRQERTRVGKVIEKILGDRAASLDALVNTCVELRALRARRWVEGTLRAWLPLHVALVVVAVGLAAVHVYAQARYR
jgi:hypothetical protein